MVEDRLATLQGELQQIDAKMSEDIAAKKEAMTIELNNRVKKYFGSIRQDEAHRFRIELSGGNSDCIIRQQWI